ncbi:hypothetical protein RG47T_2673 [Mucilaginibacter polytrichastri]|uniref:Uncharacterized protein n=2 Tax=Mucilaginibacter polytrichastri TaxID=1302689 RepID=A0A1Q5ZZL8_9SPHI|nr:hypothetical protein RG47T_2673 [Mucilaginibacter polytrichastri]SFT19069.1 hypothetical protein SAMN04487890_11586 [Mucilaginibacter polytrichastri]
MEEEHKYKHMTLEITEQEYLIKLDRKKFGLSFIRSLLKQVEVAHPSDEESFIPDRHIQPSQNHSSEPDYFGSIEEK